MLRKKILQIILILFLMTSFISLTITVSHADFSLETIFSGGQSFIDAGNDTSKTINTTNLKSVSNNIYNTLLLVAMAVAVIIGIILGLQFMLSSVEEKAEIKKAIIPYFVGCFVSFAAFGIWKLIIYMLYSI
jgi:ABC-type antimicrobial peptide transport system permease subunit